jgi:hypothetical protein
VQIWIVDVVEDNGGFVERTLDRPLGVHTLVAHDGGRASDENRIVEHQELRVEDGREIGAARRRDSPPDLFELRPRPLARTLQRRELARHTIGPDWKTQHLRPLNRHERGTDRDSG